VVRLGAIGPDGRGLSDGGALVWRTWKKPGTHVIDLESECRESSSVICNRHATQKRSGLIHPRTAYPLTSPNQTRPAHSSK
jgi:hypothetical protein